MHCIARVQYNTYMPTPNSTKTKRGANGKFLPKPLLFHLRHPNSKTNQPKFWQILSPKNSFAKTSSALFRHLPETLRAEHQRKMSFPFSRKNSPPPHQRSKEYFSLVLPSEARQGRNDSFPIGILLEKSSDFVQETQPSFRIRFFAKMRSYASRRSAFWRKRRFYFLAAGQGIEPQFDGSEPSVLPLDDPAILTFYLLLLTSLYAV